MTASAVEHETKLLEMGTNCRNTVQFMALQAPLKGTEVSLKTLYKAQTAVQGAAYCPLISCFKLSFAIPLNSQRTAVDRMKHLLETTAW